jgi:hypothetical protein
MKGLIIMQKNILIINRGSGYYNVSAVETKKERGRQKPSNLYLPFDHDWEKRAKRYQTETNAIVAVLETPKIDIPKYIGVDLLNAISSNDIYSSRDDNILVWYLNDNEFSIHYYVYEFVPIDWNTPHPLYYKDYISNYSREDLEYRIKNNLKEIASIPIASEIISLIADGNLIDALMKFSDWKYNEDVKAFDALPKMHCIYLDYWEFNHTRSGSIDQWMFGQFPQGIAVYLKQTAIWETEE